MRIGIYLLDLNRAKTDSHGIINYALGLVRSLDRVLPRDDELFLLVNSEILDELGELTRARATVGPNPSGPFQRLTSDHCRSVRWARRFRLDVVHFPKGFLPLFWAADAVQVATLHDAIPLTLRGANSTSELAKRRYFRWALRRSLRRADVVFAPSSDAAKDLEKTSAGVHAPIFVTYEGHNVPRLPVLDRKDRREAVLVFGSRLPHKQTESTLRALIPAAQRRDLELIVLGNVTPQCETLLQQAKARRIVEFLSEAELYDLIGSVRAVVFGSSHEGFGLPPIEAWVRGTPATALRRSAMAEVLAGLPGLHDDLTEHDVGLALDEVLSLDDPRIRELAATVGHTYAWESITPKILELYRKARGIR